MNRRKSIARKRAMRNHPASVKRNHELEMLDSEKSTASDWRDLCWFDMAAIARKPIVHGEQL